MKSIYEFLEFGSVVSVSRGIILIGVMAAHLAQAADLPIACTSVINEKSRLDCYDDYMTRMGHEVVARKSAGAEPSPATSSSKATAAGVTPEASASSAAPSAGSSSRDVAKSAAANGADIATAVTPTTSALPSAASASSAEEFGFSTDQIRRKRETTSASDDESSSEELVAEVKSVSKRAYGEIQVELDNGQVWVESQRSGATAPEVGEAVTIKRAMFGSYLLSQGEGRALRVKRVQ